MRSAVLTRLVSTLAIALAIGCTGETDDGSDCYNDVHRSFTVSLPSPDSAIDYAANTCRLDAGACPKLCDAILARLQITQVTPGTCDVGFTSSEAKVDIGYQVAKNGCFVPGPVEEGSGNF